jgi:hypothetical protein
MFCAVFRCRQVDYLSFFIETIMEDFMEHLKCYKTAQSKVFSSEGEGQERLVTTIKVRKIEDAYFDGEDEENPWKDICRSQQARNGQETCDA